VEEKSAQVIFGLQVEAGKRSCRRRIRIQSENGPSQKQSNFHGSLSPRSLVLSFSRRQNIQVLAPILVHPQAQCAAREQSPEDDRTEHFPRNALFSNFPWKFRRFIIRNYKAQRAGWKTTERHHCQGPQLTSEALFLDYYSRDDMMVAVYSSKRVTLFGRALNPSVKNMK